GGPYTFICLLYVSSFDIDFARPARAFFCPSHPALPLSSAICRLLSRFPRFFANILHTRARRPMAETVRRMVVHHPARLHVGVDDGRSDELEPAPGQIL